MFFQIATFLLDVAAGLLGGACLLRFYMQWQRIPFGNPVGRFLFAITDWIVLPLRKVLPGYRRFDTSSVLAAYLIELAQFGILALMLGRGYAVVPVLAVFGLVRLVISGAIGLVIVYAILSWVQADSPIVDVIDPLTAPLLWLLMGRAGFGAYVPVLALFGLVRLAISGAIGLVIVAAILSWVRVDSPIADIVERLAAPLLRPFRRVIPLVGGFDLSPLAALVALQVLAIIVAHLQSAVVG